MGVRKMISFVSSGTSNHNSTEGINQHDNFHSEPLRVSTTLTQPLLTDTALTVTRVANDLHQVTPSFSYDNILTLFRCKIYKSIIVLSGCIR